MSQTKLNAVVCRFISSVLHSIIRHAWFMQAVAIVLVMALPALGVVDSWTAGGAGTNLWWSNASNWSGGVPGTSSDVLFSGSASSSGSPPVTTYSGGTSAGAVTNEVTFNKTINTLTFSQMDGGTSAAILACYHNVKIDPGVTLKILGSYTYSDTAAYGVPGPWSFYAGNTITTTTQRNLKTSTYFTGGGSLDISDASGHNTGGDIEIRQLANNASGYYGYQTAYVDLTGLSSFNANVDQLLIGYSGTNNTNYQRATGTLYLAQNNVLTLNNTSIGLAISYDPTNGNMNSNSVYMFSTLYLGQTNVIAVDNVWIGAAKGGGALAFNTAQFPNASLYLRGVNPTGGSNALIPTGTITVADGSQSGSSPSRGVMDLTGGHVDILASQIIVGRDTTGSNTNARTITGSLVFDNGNIVVTPLAGSSTLQAMEIAHHSNTSPTVNANMVCQGTVTVGSNAHLTVNGEMEMAYMIYGTASNGTTGSATAILNINGGTVTMGGNIDKGTMTTSATTYSTATININGGTLDMGGHDIGNTAGTVPIDTFTMHGGTLLNMHNITVTNFTAAGNVSMGSGNLTIGSGGKIDLRDNAAQTISGTNLSLLGNSSLYFELSSNPSTLPYDQINLTNSFTLASGNLNLVVSSLGSGFGSGTYTLMTYAAPGPSVTPTFVNTTRCAMTPTLGSTALTLAVTYNAGHDLTWSTGASGSWDISQYGSTSYGTKNWNSNSDQYYDNDTVNFTDAGSGSTYTIQLSNALTGNGMVPGTHTVGGLTGIGVNVNSGNNYTFTALAATTDRISGSAGLLKDGSGTLQLNLPSDDYTGTTYLNGGKIVLCDRSISATATPLGSASAPLIIANNAMLDLNTQQLYAKPITVQGSGIGGYGAIVNNNTTTNPGATQYDVSNLTLADNTTIGGASTTSTLNAGLPGGQYAGRWSMRAQTGSPTLSTSGNNYSLTKTGNNQIMLVNVPADTALGDIKVNEGVLSLQGTTTLGDANYRITVDGLGANALGLDPNQTAGGSILQFYNLSTPISKHVTLKNNGQLYALYSGTANDNTVAGDVLIDSTGGIINAGGTRADYPSNTPQPGVSGTTVPNPTMIISGTISGSGPLTKAGPGTVTISNPSNSYNGTTTFNDGTLIVTGVLNGSMNIIPLDSSASIPTFTTPTLAGTGTLGGGGGTITVGGSSVCAFNATIAPGPDAAPGSVGTLAVNNLTFNTSSPTYGGAINFDLASSPGGSNDKLNVNGNLAFNSSSSGTPTKTTIAINEVGGQGSISGTYNLISYTGSHSWTLGTISTYLKLTGVAVSSRCAPTLWMIAP